MDSPKEIGFFSFCLSPRLRWGGCLHKAHNLASIMERMTNSACNRGGRYSAEVAYRRRRDFTSGLLGRCPGGAPSPLCLVAA
jgi:hypothetical protein